MVLEVGCSSGYFLRDLGAAFPDAFTIGADYTGSTLDRLGEALPGVPLLRFDLTRCPLPDGSVDAVVLLNVIEHIEDDAAALAQVHRILCPGGVMVLEVPAGPHLYDAYDHFLMHHRRYAMDALLELGRGAGFAIAEQSHLGTLLYPAFWLAKVRSRAKGIPDESERERFLRRAIGGSGRSGPLGRRLMEAEAWLRRRVRLPVGIRCLVAGRKPGRGVRGAAQ